jgi:sporulation protein YlmC with PRC-barrel domain
MVIEGGNINMHTSEILGKEILDVNANSVGRVADIDINLPQWTVNQIVAKTGLIKKLSISIDKIDKVGDKVILKVTRSELEKAPLAAK